MFCSSIIGSYHHPRPVAVVAAAAAATTASSRRSCSSSISSSTAFLHLHHRRRGGRGGGGIVPSSSPSASINKNNKNSILLLRRSLSSNSIVVPSSSSSPSVSSSSLSSPPSSSFFEEWLDIEFPEGRCVGVRLKEEEEEKVDSTKKQLQQLQQLEEEDLFHPEEISFGMNNLTETSRKSFWIGRLAIKLAIQRRTMGREGEGEYPNYPILKDSFGRPKFDTTTTTTTTTNNNNNSNNNNELLFGSISHKQNWGVAIVTNEPGTRGVGIDIEYIVRRNKRKGGGSNSNSSSNIAKRILTENEIQTLGKIPGMSIEEEVMLRFSLKEAIYKASHPILNQYVSFKEAEVTPYPDGTATCEWFLSSSSTTTTTTRREGEEGKEELSSHNNKSSIIKTLDAHWTKLDDYGFFLTTARVT